MRSLLLLLVACSVTAPTSTIEQGLCTEDNAGCITPWVLVQTTRDYYGSDDGRVDCGPVSGIGGMHHTVCVVSVDDVQLFQCTFSYYIDMFGDGHLTEIDCY
jgi:hypothetical protein